MAEPIPEIPYDHHIYHAGTQPSLHEAIQAFEAAGAQQAINTVIRDCFLKHNVEKNFSACILHRHFDLSPDERNIEEGGRAIASSDLDNIHPSSWLYYQGRLVPYEFTRIPVTSRDDLPALPQEFITDLGHILQDRGLCHVIGIQSYTDGIVGMESTDHDARVSTTVTQSEKDPFQPQGIAKAASFAFF